jgi:TP901 family phage tail tape measure protein
VSLEKITAWIATTASVTQRSAETVGTAYQSMLSRIQNIKLGNLDSEGETINDVEKALARINIRLRDSEGQFRNTGTVIDEVAKKWSGLTSIERQSVAQAVAG